MAQSVKCPTLGFGSGHGPVVRGFEPHIGLCVDSVEPAWDSLSPSLSLLVDVHALALARSQNKST